MKSIVGSIVITDPGSGYKNKEEKIVSGGISTAKIVLKSKNMVTKLEKLSDIRYGSSAISGIVESKDYYVRKIDSDKFSLSEVGVGGTSPKYFFDREIIVDIKSVGEGTFNYEPIVVTVSGVTGIDSVLVKFQCQVQPVFRGSVDSIDLTNEGVGYGSSEILNFNRQPDFSFYSGSSAQVEPVINGGRIVDIVITNPGNGYICPPNLVITGPGRFARLTPIITNGRLTEVKIINSGAEYVPGQTQIEVQGPGNNATVEFDINEWNVNLFRETLT